MFEFWRRYRLRKAFQRYVQILGPALVRRYGPLDQFTVAQIQATAGSLKLDLRFIAYAVALYRQDASENTVNLLRLDQPFLDLLRAEIAEAFFDGDVGYNAQAVLALSTKPGWQGGPVPDWLENSRGRTSL